MLLRNLLAPLLAGFLSYVAGCASGFERFYIPASGINPGVINAHRSGPPPPRPAIERTSFQGLETTLMTLHQRGFKVIGHSLFNAPTSTASISEIEDAALRHGVAVGADLVVSLNPEYTGSTVMPMPVVTPTTTTSYTSGSATAYGASGPVTVYGDATTTTYGSTITYLPFTTHRSDYGAIYLVKWRYQFGASVRDLNDAERQELGTNKGVVVLMTIDGSPAYNADILPGDIIARIGDVPISNGQSFVAALENLRGSGVSVSIVRREDRIKKTVQLND